LGNSNKEPKSSENQSQTPRERGVYWTEYVVRYHGARHLKSVADESYTGVEQNVWLFIAFILMNIGIIEYYVIRWFLRLIKSLFAKSSAGKSAVSEIKTYYVKPYILFSASC
jgi:hypothetical protein